jgi:tetratricopeptide (TPR) repeat protein
MNCVTNGQELQAKLVMFPGRWIAVASLIAAFALCSPESLGQLRKSKVGDPMPEFSLPSAKGEEFAFEHGQEKVTAVAFVDAEQDRSRLAIEAIGDVALKLIDHAGEFRVVAVCTDANEMATVAGLLQESAGSFHILADEDYGLWGKLGVIVRPTVVVAGKDDTISWIKAGYGYDFVPSLRLALEAALGIVDANTAEDPKKVRTLDNKTAQSRIERHVQMSRLLAKKGRFDSAAEQLQIAQRMDPNSAALVLELAELHCRAGQGAEALEAISTLEPVNQADRARARMLAGWARRIGGDLEGAEKCLLEAVKLDPASSAAYFELGKVYEEDGRDSEAMQAYRQALELIFGETSHPSSSQSE